MLTISFPCLFIAFYKLIEKFKPKINKKIEKAIDIVGNLILIVMIGIIFLNNKRFMKDIMMENNWILMFGAILISLALIYGYFIILNNEKYKKIEKIIRYICLGIVAVVIVITGHLYINNSYAQNEYGAHHWDAYFYPIYKILSGLTPGVDFNSLYGYYSYFFALIMKLFNTTSILAFSYIITAIVIITLSCLAIISNKFIKNKVILVFAVLSYIYTLLINICVSNQSVYLQYMPHRVLFPSIILAYMLVYFKFRDGKYKNLFQLIGFIISAIAIFWNLETGMIVLLVWMFSLGYEILFYNSLKSKETYKQIGKIIVMGILSLVLYYIMLNLITLIREGKAISIQDILFGQSIFLGSGFNMLRMKLVHPWILLVSIYAITLIISLRKLKFMSENNTKNFEKNSILFSLAILGIGIFSYYQGRSCNDTFAFVIYPAIIILGIFLDTIIAHTYVHIKKHSKDLIIKNICNVCQIIIISATLTVLASSTIYYFFNNDSIRIIRNKEQLFSTNYMKDDIERARQIKELVPDTEFLLENDSYIYNELNMKDNRNFYAHIDLFRYKDYEKILDYLSENDVSFCTDAKIIEVMHKKYLYEFVNIVSKKYKLVIVGKWMLFVSEANWDKVDVIKEIYKEEETLNEEN